MDYKQFAIENMMDQFTQLRTVEIPCACGSLKSEKHRYNKGESTMFCCDQCWKIIKANLIEMGWYSE